jgi:predicted DNA-binding protein
MPAVRLTVPITPELHDKLKALAKRDKRAVSHYVENLLEKHVQRAEASAK